MRPTYFEASRYAKFLRDRFVLTGVSGSEVAIEAVERNRHLAMMAFAILDRDIRDGVITLKTPEVTQLLDYIEKTYELCFGPEAQVPNGPYFHRRELEILLNELPANKTRTC